MIDLPLDQIKQKILEETDMSEDALDEKIEEKLDQLSGLISEQGAAHIIANDLGVQLVESSGRLQIKNVVEGLRDVELAGKVSAVYEVNEFERDDGSTGRVGNFMLADETGRIRMVLWGSKADAIEELERGDTVLISSGYVRKNRDRVEVHVNEDSELEKDPAVDIDVDLEDAGTTRKSVRALEAGDQYVEILATVVQLFDPRFFEIYAESGKRVEEDDPDEETEFSYVTNAFLDDGSDTVRGVFWRQQTQDLLGLDDDEVQEIRDDQSVFDDVKKDLLGKIIRIEGRVEENEAFDRLEFVARSVDTDPDPDEEMEKLDESEQDAEIPEITEGDGVEDGVADTASDSDSSDDLDTSDEAETSSDTDTDETDDDESDDSSDDTEDTSDDEKAGISKEALEDGMVEEEDFDDDDIPELDEL